MCVCVCPYLLDVALLPAIAPVFPFPLRLITRVPVNPRYHQGIKRRPQSLREPISSESRTQTGKLLDIFAGLGKVQTLGAKKKILLNIALLLVGLHYGYSTSDFTHIEGKKKTTNFEIGGCSFKKKIVTKRERKKNVGRRFYQLEKGQRYHRVEMRHSRPSFSACSGCFPAAAVKQNN